MTGLFIVAILAEFVFAVWCFWQVLLLIYEKRSNPLFLLLHRNVKEIEVAIGEPFLPVLTSITENVVKLLRKFDETRTF